MTTRQLTRITMMACLMMAIFEIFANILYLELITFTILVFALTFPRKEVVSAAALFAVLHMLMAGITPWSIGYLIMYPIYACCFSYAGNWLLAHPRWIPLTCGIASLLAGQLMDLPFLLFSTKVTIFYIITGLKTSLIQGTLSFLATLFLWEPVVNVLKQIRQKEQL